mgnify:CR=1 FL=1
MEVAMNPFKWSLEDQICLYLGIILHLLGITLVATIFKYIVLFLLS